MLKVNTLAPSRFVWLAQTAMMVGQREKPVVKKKKGSMVGVFTEIFQPTQAHYCPASPLLSLFGAGK